MGVKTIPIPTPLITSKSRRENEDLAYFEAVINLERSVEAKGLLNTFQTRMRENISNFDDPTKFSRHASFDNVAREFKIEVMKKQERIKELSAELRQANVELENTLQERDRRLRALDPGYIVKNHDTRAFFRENGIQLQADDIDTEVLRSRTETSAGQQMVTGFQLTADEDGDFSH